MTTETLRPALADADALYVTGEDNLRVTSFNATAGVVLAIEGRFLRCDGRVIPIVERHTPNTDRTSQTSIIGLAEGWLSNLMVRASSGSPLNGSCFVIVELIRGNTGAVQPLACLLQGYASANQRLAWPGPSVASSVAAGGNLRQFSGTDPAANVEIVETVPVGARWSIRSFFATLVADANVANRTVTLILDDGVNTLLTVDASAVQTAGQTRNYEAYATGVAPDLTGTTFRLPLPFPLTLAAGSRIRTSTANRQVGDNWSAPQLLIEEWIAG